MIAILYTIIYLKLRSQLIPGEQSVNAERQRAKRERNVLKMALALVLWFAVCWLPFSIIDLLYIFEWDFTTFSCSITHFHSITNFMPYTNCAINPCICFIFSGNYRHGLKSLLRRRFCLLKERASHTESSS